MSACASAQADPKSQVFAFCKFSKCQGTNIDLPQDSTTGAENLFYVTIMLQLAKLSHYQRRKFYTILNWKH